MIPGSIAGTTLQRLLLIAGLPLNTMHTVRSDAEERVAKERPAWKHKNVPAWTKNIIKFSTLSAPTKIEELTAGSDEKTQRSPAANRTQAERVENLIRNDPDKSEFTIKNVMFCETLAPALPSAMYVVKNVVRTQPEVKNIQC